MRLCHGPGRDGIRIGGSRQTGLDPVCPGLGGHASDGPRSARWASHLVNRNLSIYLDLVRLCAALGVFLGHARRFLDPELSKLVATHATECVAIFFVMSGFVIRHVTRDSAAGLTSYGLDRAARMWSVVAPAILVTLAADRIGASINPAFYQTLEFWDGTGRFAEILTSLLFLNEAWGCLLYTSPSPRD